MSPPTDNLVSKNEVRKFLNNKMSKMITNSIKLFQECNFQKNQFNYAIFHGINGQIISNMNSFYHSYYQKNNIEIINLFDTLKNNSGKDPICTLHFIYRTLTDWNKTLFLFYEKLYDNHSNDNIVKFIEEYSFPEGILNFVDIRCTSCQDLNYNPNEDFIVIVPN